MNKRIVWPVAALLAAALAGCGAAGANGAAAGTGETAAAPTAAPETAGAPAGSLRWLDEYDAGRCYMAGWSEQDNAYAVAAAYDYAAAAVQPLCSLPGCAHDSPGCEAWRRITMGVGQVAADGGEVFFCYSSGGLRNSGDAAADAELAAWQAEHEGAPVAHIDVCRADGSGRRRLVEFPALDNSEAGTLQMWAADDRSLYVTVRLTNDPADSGDDTRALYAVDRRSGACTELAPNVDTPVFVSGRGLYLFEYELEGEGTADVRDKGVQVRRLDADTGAWSDGVHHENSWGPASPQGESSGGCYLTAAGGGARSLLRADTMNGTLEVLDPDSGETLATVTGLPAAAEGTHVDWQCRELENWYAVQSFELPWGSSEGVERLFLAPRTGGAAQEVKLYQYVSARGADPIYLYDEWNGRLFCHAAYRETPATMLGKDGVPYATSDIEDIYALLPVESALAGADDYTYFTNWPGLAR